MTADQIRIIVVDDHPMFREGVARTLSSETDIDVVGEGVSTDDAIELTEDLLPDIALLDISMPGNGIAAARKISSSYPVVKIVMLTASENDEDVIAALEAGACAYILKGVNGGDLVRIVRNVHGGESYIAPDLAARLIVETQKRKSQDLSSDPLSELTARELQILERVATGLQNKEIAAELAIQEKTVKHYMTNILQKLQVRNRVEAALLAQKHLPPA